MYTPHAFYFQNIRTFINSCLSKATDYRAETIAFPAIAAGNLGYPVDIVASEMFDSVERFLRAKQPTYLKTVYFVVYGGDTKAVQVSVYSYIPVMQNRFFVGYFQLLYLI